MVAKIIYLRGMMLCLVALSANGAEVNDPEAHFIAGLPREPSCHLRAQVDLNKDQVPEVFFSLQSRVNGRAGNIWEVYIRTEGTFITAASPVTFHLDAVFAGFIEEIDEPGLIGYFPGSSLEGSLIIVQVKQGQLVERRIGWMRPRGADAALYERYFGLPSLEVVQKPLFGGKCSEI